MSYLKGEKVIICGLAEVLCQQITEKILSPQIVNSQDATFANGPQIYQICGFAFCGTYCICGAPTLWQILKMIYRYMYCMTAINKCPSIKSDTVERWRGEDYRVNTGRSNGPARLGEGGGAALVCQEIGGSVEKFHITIVYL